MGHHRRRRPEAGVSQRSPLRHVAPSPATRSSGRTSLGPLSGLGRRGTLAPCSTLRGGNGDGTDSEDRSVSWGLHGTQRGRCRSHVAYRESGGNFGSDRASPRRDGRRGRRDQRVRRHLVASTCGRFPRKDATRARYPRVGHRRQPGRPAFPRFRRSGGARAAHGFSPSPPMAAPGVSVGCRCPAATALAPHSRTNLRHSDKPAHSRRVTAPRSGQPDDGRPATRSRMIASMLGSCSNRENVPAAAISSAACRNPPRELPSVWTRSWRRTA
jgi:hypothetical protein